MLLGLSLATGATIVLVGLHIVRRGSLPEACRADDSPKPSDGAIKLAPPQPGTWLVVRSRRLRDIQLALRLHNSKPCPCTEALSGGRGVFIAPPADRWTLVTGSGLPEPGEDIDLCFRFLQRVSRCLGTVQYFNVNRLQSHHAWIWCERGRVVRAYAWTGYTAWNQGPETTAERELGLRCLPYSDPTESRFEDDFAAANTEKVSLLAARWGADPVAILDALREPAHGIAGDPWRLD